MNYYIHVPFCASRCGYCVFYSESAPGNEIRECYLNKIISDLECCTEKCSTVYIGGGTPTFLSSGQLERLLEAVHFYLQPSSDTEISIEANPETLTSEKVDILKKYVNRISTGVQSFSEKNRQILGRKCSAYQLEKALDLVGSAGFRHWNCDLIYAVPGQTCNDWEKEFEFLEKYCIDHVSCYNLTPEEGARLSNLEPDMDIAPELEDITRVRLEARGILQYEVSNYALPGAECRHNIHVWRGGLLRGLGPSAAGFDGIDRQCEISSIRDWLSGALPEVDHISVPERLNEIFAVNLRTVAGWKCDFWLAVPHHDSWQERLRLAGAVEKIYPGCFDITADSIKLTRKGLAFWDTIAEELLS